MRHLCSPVQQAVEDRGWHLVDLAHDAHVVRDLPVRIKQHADGQLVPGGGTGEDISYIRGTEGTQDSESRQSENYIISQKAGRIRPGIPRVQ